MYRPTFDSPERVPSIGVACSIIRDKRNGCRLLAQPAQVGGNTIGTGVEQGGEVESLRPTPSASALRLPPTFPTMAPSVQEYAPLTNVRCALAGGSLRSRPQRFFY